jgi:hypothetical protein
MTKIEYYEKLKDPRWQKKRLEILERDEWSCRNCGDHETTLHVHHIFYLPKNDPWEISNGFLITLCEKCHKSGPCNDEYKKCEYCPDYKDNCEGPGDFPKELVDCIGALLEQIFKYKGHNLSWPIDVIGFIISKLEKR